MTIVQDNEQIENIKIMAFLEIDDMGTVIYDYQIEQIADGNDEALPEAINAAIVTGKQIGRASCRERVCQYV